MKKQEEKIKKMKFVRRFIKKFRGEYKGIHSVYSGFNEAFREYYDGADPVAFVQKMADKGKLVIKPVKGGVMIYLPEDAPQGNQALKILEKLGLK